MSAAGKDFIDSAKVSYPGTKADSDDGKHAKKECRIEFMVVTASSHWLARFEDAVKRRAPA